MQTIKFRACFRAGRGTPGMFEVNEWVELEGGWAHINGEFASSDLHIMQFTGLTDKSGKEIWEGDIVKSDISPLIAIVRVGMYEYDDGNCPSKKFCAYIEVVKYKRMGITTAMMSQPVDHTKSHYEIIGNIYENPELLKV